MAPALRFSEAAAMALHTAAFLAQDAQQPLTTKEIASRLSGSEAHLSKVLQRLVKAGLVTSARGPNGGFLLAVPAESLSLLQVWEAIDGPVGNVACMQATPLCVGNTCLLGVMGQKVNTMVRGYLGNLKLADIDVTKGYLVEKANAPA